MTQKEKLETFSLVPTTLDEAMRYAEIMAKSSVVPKDYQNKPGDILVAVQMGAEVGLKPIQALQNISVINGRPAIWGDAALALVKSNPLCVDIIETYDDKEKIARCVAKRKGKSDVIGEFSYEEAKKAGLISRETYQKYEKRMIKMRARSYALRDQFTDVLKGLILAEEAQDYPMQDITSSEPKQILNPNATLDDILKSKVEALKKAKEEEIQQPEIIALTETDELPWEKLERLVKEKGVSDEDIMILLEKGNAEHYAELSDKYIEAAIRKLENSEKYK